MRNLKLLFHLPLALPPSLPPLALYAKLIPKSDSPLLLCYIEWLRLLAMRGFHLKPVHAKTFNYLYRAVSRTWPEQTLLGWLQQEFIRRNLSLSLLLEPLDGFEWLSKKRYPLSFAKASPILLQIIAPMARFVAILNNQHPPFYQPFSSLIFAYTVLYTLKMPGFRQILQTARLQVEDKVLLQQLPWLLKEAIEGLSVIIGFRFKAKVAFFLALCRRLLHKTTLQDENKINFFDYVNAFLYGLWYTLTIRNNSKKRNII